MNIVFLPIFKNSSQLTDHYYRLHWYLYPLRKHIERITLFYDCDNVLESPPEYLSIDLLDISKKMSGVEMVKVNRLSNCKKTIQESDIVLIWEIDNQQAGKVPLSLENLIQGKHVVRIDHNNEQFAGSFYLKLAELLSHEINIWESQSKQVFSKIMQKCKNQKGYIFGTGPGLSLAKDYDFSDGINIACNSMVRNKRLLEQLKPPLIVVGDPIFHAGPSSYAAAFRKDLIEALDAYDAYLIVPMRDYHIYHSHLPKRFKERISAIPFKQKKKPNLNLEKSFYVATTGNILTLFLIPLASSFFKEVKIFGCDGRPLDDNKYFWSHDKESQFNEEMEGIQTAHPAFFAIDYDDYYSTHTDTLEKWLNTAEKQTTFLNMTPTYIPALLSRSNTGIGMPSDTVSNNKRNKLSKIESSKNPLVSIIMPAYNADKYIDIAIKSILNQDFKDWELLVIDDASSDKTEKIVKTIIEADTRVKLFKNLGDGVSSARNMGIDNAVGKFICFLDADDAFDLSAISARLAAFTKKPGLSLVHGPVHFINEIGEELGFTLQLKREMDFSDMSSNRASLNSIMGRSSLIKKFRFDEGVTNGEDWWFLARVLRSGEKSDFVANGGASYRVHANSTVLKNMHQHETNLKLVIDWLYKERTSPHITEKYIQGLQSPPKEDVLIRRIYNLFVWSVLQRDKVSICNFLKQDFLVNWMIKQKTTFFKNSISVPGIRCFGMHKNKLASLPKNIRKNIENVVIETQLDQMVPSFVKSLAQVFELDAKLFFIKQDTKKLKKTNIQGCLNGSSSSEIFMRSANAVVDETQLIYKLVDHSPGKVMIDVGAHFGGSSYKFFKKDWEIYAFEPDTENRKKFIEKLGNKKNVHLDIRAVGEHVEKSKAFYASSVSTGISGMLVFEKNHKQVDTVDVTTITNVVNENNIKHVDFLKIDVEGYDFSVLKGVPWDKIKPDVVECEFEDAKTKLLGHSWKDICEYLVDKGYIVYVSEWHPIVRYGIRHDWLGIKKYPCELEDENAWGNLLAFRVDPGESKINDAVQAVIDVKNPDHAISVEDKKTALANSQVQVVSSKKNKPNQFKRGVYVRFAEWARDNNQAIFRLGQLSVWYLRYMKRHPMQSMMLIAMCAALILLPNKIPELFPYKLYMYSASSVIIALFLITTGVAFLNRKLLEFVAREDRLRSGIKRQIDSLNKSLSEKLSQAQTTIDEQVQVQAQQSVEMSGRIDAQSQQQDELEAAIGELRAEDEKLSQAQTTIDEQVQTQARNQDQFLNSSPLVNFCGYQSFNRHLNDKHIEIFQKKWARILGIELKPKFLAYLAHRIFTIECSSRGRLATTTEDALLRTLVAGSVRGRKLRVLEIGTLFGIGLSIIYDYARPRYESVHLTAIDPLDGYYGKDVKDIVTSEPISESTFSSNLARAGVQQDDYTLIKAVSTDDMAIDSIGGQLHDILIIDGDHSYSGVKADFVNYMSTIKRGGYIIFDDYGASDWPDVQKFVDEVVVDNPNLALVGIEWRTAVFKVVKRAKSGVKNKKTGKK